MYIFYLVGLGLGSVGVFQTIINGQFGNQSGFTLMALINSFAGFIFTGTYAVTVFWWPHLFPEMLRIPADLTIKWWYFLPALTGLVGLILGPFILIKIGAFHSVIATIVGQILTAFLWDTLAQHHPISFIRIMGLILTAGGAYLSFKK